MRRLAIALMVLAVCTPASPAAGATYEPGAFLVSASPERREQGDGPTVRADMTGDSRFVVFETRARNFFADNDPEPPGAFRDGGIFRRDLLTGALDLIAYGDLRPTSGGTFRIGAHNPSVSDDGRWVAFTTAAALDPADTNSKVDVYVRDMTKPVEDPSAHELVSARDGGDTPASYGFPTSVNGSEITAGAGISADGRMVVFRTRAPSDLPATEFPATPLGQIFVRDRQSKTTTLVTRRMDDGSPAGGADAPQAPAGISADGSTVVWTGTNAGLQTFLFPGEPDFLPYYLWRRVADGPSAPTRRITGVPDPDDPGCPPKTFIPTGDFTSVGPCWGPLTRPEGDQAAGNVSDRLPALSADGRKVAMLVGAVARPSLESGNQLDVFITDMTDGITRKAGTVELTRESQQDVSSVEAVALSRDARRVAFVTARTTFSLPSPGLITPRPTTSGETELYVVNLESMELERAALGYDGDEINGSVTAGIGTLAMSDNASRIAFVSRASNHFFGDSNSEPDAFVLSEADPNADALRAAGEPPFGELRPPADEAAKSAPRLGLKVKRRGGALRLTVRVPAAGRVLAKINARLRRGAKARPIASARRKATRAGHVTLTLRTPTRYRRALRRQKLTRVRVVATFSPAAGGARITAGRTVSLPD
jgi:Tol biopolymer transport system component